MNNSESPLQLPEIDNVLLSLNNRIVNCFSDVVTELENDEGTWQIEPDPFNRTLEKSELDNTEDRQVVAELLGHRHTMFLAIDHFESSSADVERPWWDYSGKSQILAWTLTHHSILSHLDALMGTRWKVASLVSLKVALPHIRNLQHVRLDWSLIAKKSEASGQFYLTPPHMHQWANLAEGNKLPQTLNNPESDQPFWCARIQLEWWVLTKPLSLPYNQYCSLNIHDTLFLTADLNDLLNSLELCQIQSGQLMPCICDGQDIRITTSNVSRQAPASKHPYFYIRKESQTPMTQESSSQDNTIADDVPVQLDFKIGEHISTMGELKSFKPGYTLSLDQNVENITTYIYANGKRVAKGQLVAAGDQVGVRILEFETSWRKPGE